MQLYGLTGGIGSGKSTVAAMLEGLGFSVVRADWVAREVVARGTPGHAQVAKAFGPGVLGPSGELDRHRLASIVFGDQAERARLEVIVHPLITQRSQEIFGHLAASGAALAFYEATLLFQNNREKEMDGVVLVTAPRAIRIARVSARDGISPAEVERRMVGQLSEQDLRRRADYVIENHGDLNTLRERVRVLAKEIFNGEITSPG